ncbi:Metal-dependent_hydrolase [Hexamita inflata]|uniref:Metal-dependent hydrolase n=1 Tax=Hexamita inflata TaxID=28002 RepID=A0AA86TP70_9EUKA|nr:Metal-dependent hydrolase [Hexamita inflata]
MKLHFLGTHAGFPSKFGATSGLVIEFPSRLILIDAPENSQQIMAQLSLSIQKLSAILITHMHMDHVAGLVPLLQSAFVRDRTMTLTLYGPPGITEYVNTINKLTAGEMSPNFKIVEVSPGFEFTVNDVQFTAVKMSHVVECNGYYMRTPLKKLINLKKAREDGFPFGLEAQKLKNFEDVQINDRLFKAADYTETEGGNRILFTYDTNLKSTDLKQFKGLVDLLVTECSFADDKLENCTEYGHSCVCMVIDTLKEIECNKVVVTHVSQRYGGPSEHPVQKELEFKKRSEFIGSPVPDWVDMLEARSHGWVEIK